jgi:hypothetical protein
MMAFRASLFFELCSFWYCRYRVKGYAYSSRVQFVKDIGLSDIGRLRRVSGVMSVRDIVLCQLSSPQMAERDTLTSCPAQLARQRNRFSRAWWATSDIHLPRDSPRSHSLKAIPTYPLEQCEAAQERTCTRTLRARFHRSAWMHCSIAETLTFKGCKSHRRPGTCLCPKGMAGYRKASLGHGRGEGLRPSGSGPSSVALL